MENSWNFHAPCRTELVCDTVTSQAILTGYKEILPRLPAASLQKMFVQLPIRKNAQDKTRTTTSTRIVFLTVFVLKAFIHLVTREYNMEIMKPYLLLYCSLLSFFYVEVTNLACGQCPTYINHTY